MKNTFRTLKSRAKELVIGKEYHFDTESDTYGKLVRFDEAGDPEFELINNEIGLATGSNGLAPFFNIPHQDFWEKK